MVFIDKKNEKMCNFYEKKIFIKMRGGKGKFLGLRIRFEP